MTSALIAFYIVVALALIIFVLLQDPKGDGALFGGGGGQSLFGATGATSFIVKATRTAAVLFAVCVVALNYTLMSKNNNSAVLNNETEISAPVLETKKEETPAPVEAAPEKSEE